MRFLCLGYYDKAMDREPKEVVDEILHHCKPHLENLYRSGQVILDAGLEKGTVTVRTVNGNVTVTDGPFTETREILGGAFVVEADNVAEATRVASLHPAANLGEQFGFRIEIRPIASYETSESIRARRDPPA